MASLIIGNSYHTLRPVEGQVPSKGVNIVFLKNLFHHIFLLSYDVVTKFITLTKLLHLLQLQQLGQLLVLYVSLRH